jgi:uncharacterized membrane-anchored protein YhcB (DUF1043 family)
MIDQLCQLVWFLPEISETWIPIVGTIAGTLTAVIIVALALMSKQQQRELEHALQLRRMEHERRMRELELELARLHAGAAQRQ